MLWKITARSIATGCMLNVALMASESRDIEKDIEALERRLEITPLNKVDAKTQLLLRCWSIPEGDDFWLKTAAIYCVTLRVPLVNGVTPSKNAGTVSGVGGVLSWNKLFLHDESKKNCIHFNINISAGKIADLIGAMQQTEVFRLPKYFGSDKWSHWDNVSLGGIRVIFQRWVFDFEDIVVRTNGKGGFEEFLNRFSNILLDTDEVKSHIEEELRRLEK